ncbi:MAG: hypothetical protein Q9190_005312 [Brigantiaea leucoxantha]
MDDYEEIRHPFSVPDLWPKSSLALFQEFEINHELEHIESLPKVQYALNALESSEIFAPTLLTIPPVDEGQDLRNYSTLFASQPLEELESIGSVSLSSDQDDVEKPEFDLDDLWSQPVLNHGQDEAELKSWEKFYQKTFKEPCTAYLSEGGPRVFDAVLNLGVDDGPFRKATTPAIHQDTVIRSLFQLGLGRESAMFQYADDLKSFRLRTQDVRMSGYTLECSSSLITEFVDLGNDSRMLQTLTASVFESPTTNATALALASAIDTIVAILHEKLGSKMKTIQSVLQLQDLFRRPGESISCLSGIATRTLQSKTDDEEILSQLLGVLAASTSASRDFSTYIKTVA